MTKEFDYNDDISEMMEEWMAIEFYCVSCGCKIWDGSFFYCQDCSKGYGSFPPKQINTTPYWLTQIA